MITFNLGPAPYHHTIPSPPPSDAQIEQEPMFYRASAHYAQRHGGPCTLRALYELARIMPPSLHGALRIDTRSHLLMPGDLPSRGGWHCDFMQDTDYTTIASNPMRDVQVRHWMIVSGHPTPQFLRERSVRVERDPNAFTWRDVDQAIDYEEGVHPVWVEPWTISEFDGTELHRCTPWAGPGATWRWFFRASYFPEGTEYANKIRTQVQVYR